MTVTLMCSCDTQSYNTVLCAIATVSDNFVVGLECCPLPRHLLCCKTPEASGLSLPEEEIVKYLETNSYHQLQRPSSSVPVAAS